MAARILGSATCKMQNAKVKMEEKGTMASGHTSILHFAIFNLHFTLAAAAGRALRIYE